MQNSEISFGTGGRIVRKQSIVFGKVSQGKVSQGKVSQGKVSQGKVRIL